MEYNRNSIKQRDFLKRVQAKLPGKASIAEIGLHLSDVWDKALEYARSNKADIVQVSADFIKNDLNR